MEQEGGEVRSEVVCGGGLAQRNPGQEDIFQCHIFLISHTVHEVLLARILEWSAIPPSSGPCFVRTLQYDLSWVGLHGMAHNFIQLSKLFRHDKAVIHEREGVLYMNINCYMLT